MYRIILATATLVLLVSCRANAPEEAAAPDWGGLPPTADAASGQADEGIDVRGDIDYCHHQLRRALNALGPEHNPYMEPRNICGDDTLWSCRPSTPDEWCNGFWPGILWLAYQATGDSLLLHYARRYSEPLAYLSRRTAFDHDLGFLMLTAFGNGCRITNDPRYRQILLQAADTLATLYNPRMGTLLSWPRNVKLFGGHNTIMDNMMNLELLLWAADNGAKDAKRLRDIAVTHARTTMRYQFRPDHSCYHVAVYDTLTGAFLHGKTHQGYSDDSMWARGQAWAIYSYTMMYRYTRLAEFLDFAQAVTDVYLRRLPEDMVPYWDFDDPAIPNAPRDASTAAVVADALLELQGYIEQPKSAQYRYAATQMLRELASNNYRAGQRNCAFLLHSTGNFPAGSEIDAAIIYADYYYLEALLRFIHFTN